MYTKIGIIGDVHAEHEHLDTAIQHLKALDAEIIICTGDIADGTGNLDRCVELLQTHNVVTVRGNHDRWLLTDKVRHVANAHVRQHIAPASLDYLAGLPTQHYLPTVAGNLLLCHGMADNDLQKIWPGTERMPAERCHRLDEIIASDQVSFVVNGHVHYRTLIHFSNLLLINAGTLKRVHQPGFGLLDLNRQHIQGFEFEPTVRAVRCHSVTPGPDTTVFPNTQHFNGSWQPLTLYA